MIGSNLQKEVLFAEICCRTGTCAENRGLSAIKSCVVLIAQRAFAWGRVNKQLDPLSPRQDSQLAVCYSWENLLLICNTRICIKGYLRHSNRIALDKNFLPSALLLRVIPSRIPIVRSNGSMLQTPTSPAFRIGSMDIFWTLIEPILAAFPARRVCEIGVAEGAFTARLLTWVREHGCAYVGIDPEVNLAASSGGAECAGDCVMLKGHSLNFLPTLGCCDAYFLDGDHNFFTVRNELALIAGAACHVDDCQPGPVVFVHDIGWPWGRRDMYYLPSVVPADARQTWSETLGVALEEDELVDGGLREPGRYAISVSANGPRNGVLTAVEDFLTGPEGADWSAIVLPVAYGLAILYQPANALLAAACRKELQALQKTATTTAQFFQACEQNYLQLYLRGEYTQHLAATAARDLQGEHAAHFATLAAYSDLEGAYSDLERAYGKLLAHNHALEGEYGKLLQAYRSMQDGRQRSSGVVDEAATSATALPA